MGSLGPSGKVKLAKGRSDKEKEVKTRVPRILGKTHPSLEYRTDCNHCY